MPTRTVKWVQDHQGSGLLTMAAIAHPGPNPTLAIHPYPRGWEKESVLAGRAYRFRPIKPMDAALYPAFLLS